MRLKRILAFLGIMLAAAFHPAEAQITRATDSGVQPGPVVNVVAHLDACLTIEVSTNEINFHADRGAGLYDADQAVDVRVATNYGSWTINCIGSPLVGTANQGQIPPSQIFMSSTPPGQPGIENYLSLDTTRQAAQGGSQPLSVVSTLRFRLKTEWSNRPGQYTGTLSFTYLAEP